MPNIAYTCQQYFDRIGWLFLWEMREKVGCRCKAPVLEVTNLINYFICHGFEFQNYLNDY
jgi:hypothetical protein